MRVNHREKIVYKRLTRIRYIKSTKAFPRLKMKIVFVTLLLTFQMVVSYNFLKSIEFHETNLVEAISEIVNNHFIHKSTSISISKSINVENSVVDIIAGVLQVIHPKTQIIFATKRLTTRYECNIIFADDLDGFRFVIFI